MLDALRRGSSGWVAKILLGLLVLSFAVWGIADVFTGFGRGSLAKVGDTEIRAEDFQRSFQNELSIISRQAGRRITAEQARNAGLDNRILSQLIAWAAVEQHANNLDLALSDTALVDSLKKDPAFKGSDDKFSRFAFENVLNQMGLSERGFLQLRRRDELREQVTTALINGVAVPETLIALTNDWREEKRVAQFFTIDADKAVTVPEPDEAQLKKTYDNNKGRFVTPELRKLALLVVSVDSLAGKMEVSDEDVQASYEDTKKDYDVPEKRRVQQIAFKDKAAAEAAKKALGEGKPFGDVVKEAGAKDADTDLGLVTRASLIDPKIADVAFSLEKDTVSDVVDGRFATVLLRVTDIQPAVTRSLDDVKGEVRAKLARKQAQEQLQTIIDQVDDQRLSGKTLKEVADVLKLDFVEIEGTDRYNKTKDGEPAINLPDALAIISAAFESDVGLENEPIELRDGGLAWFDVQGITAKKQKPFDQVKDEVKQLTIDTERARLVSDLAAKLVERANRGEDMAALATEAGSAEVTTTPPFTRSTDPHGLSKAAVTKAFTLQKDRAASAPTTNSKSRSVFKVTEVTPAPEPTKEQRERIAKDLQASLVDEVLSEYVVALQKNLGTTINQDEFKRVTGAETQ
jgi:peptidyl-prolyl cis-trans isomerase D